MRYDPSYTPDEPVPARTQNLLWVVLAIMVFGMLWYSMHRQPEQKIVYSTPTPKPLPPRYLAPEGTFFLVSYLSVPTPHGVVGFEPGTEVRLVAVHENTGSLLVSDGKYQVEAHPSQLTNDLGIAALARKQDERSQQTIVTYLDNERDAFEKTQQKLNQEHAASVDKINNAMVESSVIGRRQGPLNEESQPASSYDRYYRRSGGSSYGYGSPYSYFYRRQSPYYSSPYY